MKLAEIAVSGAFTVTAEPILLGKPAVMTVKDAAGELVKGVEVFAAIEGVKDPISLGKTNTDEVLKVDAITDEVKKIALYAVKDGKYSFKVNTQTYPPLAGKTELKNVIATAVGDPYKSKGFTWMSSPLAEGKSAIIQYARKKDFDKKGEQELKLAAGASSDLVFSGEQDIKKNGIVRVNEVTLTKLQQGTTYVYRVGDGKNWTDLKEFTTLKRKQSFEFAVLGDTQSPSDLSLFDKILGDLNSKDMAFMIHVGDLIDDASKFKQWDDALNTLSRYDRIRSTNLVATLGNHEYMGDVNAQAARVIFNSTGNGPDLDKGGTYSVDYHNIHISVLGFTSDDKVLEQQLQWLKQDVKQSDKPWKILVTHKPPYFTNPFGGNEIMKEKLVPVVDELGIDIVFSGHDHSYGRTKKLKNGMDDPNGTVYIVSGTTGLKHYDAVADEKFEYVNMDNIAVSLRAKVDKDRITIKTVTSDGEVIDEFTVVNEDYKEK
ncbi:metallophosphoesterase family protein [Neobacillus niacini]|uniref:purple acid phosphatase family protein n=1 Tax=Neobacillus niacini TaxID=86668 RepID=UPI0021CB9114|nr:metallophosphoesterase family protein [Neobacillus niacini]MCM3766743.1 metallophosphoesterase family protein [Neobacillus niacini]